MFEMFLFVVGTYSLVFGRIYLPWKMALHGWRARLAALFLMAPLPIFLYVGPLVSRGIPAERAQSVFGLAELALSVMGIGGALVIAVLSRPKEIKAEQDAAVGKT